MSQCQRRECVRSPRLGPADDRESDDRAQWVTVCRRKLIELETANIRRRSGHWQQLVNEQLSDANSRLSLSAAARAAAIRPFVFSVDDSSMSRYLGFIASWKGLKRRQIQHAPKTYLEFENKAKNWLNGRRAPNYAATLFPDMIKAAEIHSDCASRALFPSNASLSKMYCRLAVVGALSSLCSARISLSDSSKKTNLIPENSVKSGTSAVSQILQRYAADHPYPERFPSHLRAAADYFSNKYMELISNFGTALSEEKRHKESPPNLKPEDGAGPASQPLAVWKQSAAAGAASVSLTAEQWAKMTLFIDEMRSQQRAQRQTIDELRDRVSALEALRMESKQSVSPPSSASPQMTLRPPPKQTLSAPSPPFAVATEPLFSDQHTARSTVSTSSVPPASHRLQPPRSLQPEHAPQRRPGVFSEGAQNANVFLQRPPAFGGVLSFHRPQPPQLPLLPMANELPTTALCPAGHYDSNDSLHDLRMLGSANSSDAGMVHLGPTPMAIPAATVPEWPFGAQLDAGFGFAGIPGMV